MRSLADEGLLLKAESVASSTTPAISSILTGLTPEKHGITNTTQACESEMRSLLEWATSEDVSSAVVMEEEGARTFDGFVDQVMGVSKSLKDGDFDREILARSLQALKMDPRLLVAHFHGIDRIAHRGGGIGEIREVASEIDGHLGVLASAIPPRSMMIVCARPSPPRRWAESRLRRRLRGVDTLEEGGRLMAPPKKRTQESRRRRVSRL